MMNINIKNHILRINKVKGIYFSLFWFILSILFILGDTVIHNYLEKNYSTDGDLFGIYLMVMGKKEPIYIIFKIFYSICIILSILSWFDGILVESLKIIMIISIIKLLFNKGKLILIKINIENFNGTIGISIFILLMLYIFVRIMMLILELIRMNKLKKNDEMFSQMYKKNQSNKKNNEDIPKILDDIGDLKITQIDPFKNLLIKNSYDYSWFDSELNVPIFKENEKILNPEWIPYKNKLITTQKEKIKTLRIIYLLIGIYSLYIFFTVDNAKLPMDATMRTISLPIIVYFFICFRKMSYVLKTALIMILYVIIVNIFHKAGIISSNGIFYIYFYRLIINGIESVKLFFSNPIIFYKNFNTTTNINFLEPLSLEQTNKLTIDILTSFFTYAIIISLFLQLITWFLLSRKKSTDFIFTEKNIFLRDTSRISRIYDIGSALSILITPFNPNKYRSMFKRIQYNQMVTISESEYDIAKIPLNSIKSIRTQKIFPKYERILLIIAFCWGFYAAITNLFSFNIGNGIGYIFLEILILKYYKWRNIRVILNVIITFDRTKVKGSWIFGHIYDSIKFKNVNQIFVNELIKLSGILPYDRKKSKYYLFLKKLIPFDLDLKVKKIFNRWYKVNRF